MDLGQAFQGEGGPDRIDRILALTERLDKVDRAIDRIRYDSNLATELAAVLETLGAAKEAVVADLKTV